MALVKVTNTTNQLAGLGKVAMRGHLFHPLG